MPVKTIGQRATKLQQRLLNIRLGTGAVIIPSEIKRIHLRFAPHINGGHQGPRKFWRNELIRLKFHNPAVLITVDNKAPQDEKALMTIHFASRFDSAWAKGDSSGSAADAADPFSTARVETLDMTNQTNAQILKSFIDITEATLVEPTAQDLQELADMKVEQERHDRESAVGLEVRMRKKREEELLEQARNMIA